MRHNELRDLTTNLFREVSHDVSVEPELELLSGETIHLRSANTDAHARLDVAARGVYWSRFERTMFDVRVFNPFVPSNRDLTLPSVYRKHEQEKRRKYERRVLEVEHSSFVPVVLQPLVARGKLHRPCLPGLPASCVKSAVSLYQSWWLLYGRRSPFALFGQWLPVYVVTVGTRLDICLVRLCWRLLNVPWCHYYCYYSTITMT